MEWIKAKFHILQNWFNELLNWIGSLDTEDWTVIAGVAAVLSLIVAIVTLLKAARLCFDMVPFDTAQGKSLDDAQKSSFDKDQDSVSGDAQNSFFKGHDLTAEGHIEEAQKLIKKTGYKRRLPELEYLQDYLSTADSCG